MTGPKELCRALDTVRDRGTVLRLWWRDDDLEDAGEALYRLLDELRRFAIEPALAAIPQSLKAGAMTALADTPARLFVHGWRHINHAPADARKSEFASHRPLAIRQAEISRGWTRIAELAGARAVPCFVPPWNRLGDDLAARLAATGIEALSGFSGSGSAGGRRLPAPADVPRLDAHIDLIDWRGGRQPISAAALAAALMTHLKVDGPVGILSHHRDTGGRYWDDWRAVWSILDSHPAVRWLSPTEALSAVGHRRARGNTG